ncbi:MAG: DmsC/YnfH family molybdoenzyme membrane anchor subunit [Chthoniobacteraceae bacterium]
MNALAEPPLRTLIDDLLEEQQRLSVVERFALKHESHGLPAQSRYYKELIPLSKPRTGEQYSFAVELDICTGCKACVSACHSLNGLDEDEIWRNVGLIHGGTIAEPYVQTVTTACHHCVEPACLEGCPVKAYEKDAATGIVRHLDDQCIGCQYCVLKCPYDVPKYSHRRGIVRKCDLCYHRLAADEAPACVQACPNEAITIRIVAKAELVEQIAPGDQLLPGAFDSDYTKPATLYAGSRTFPSNARAGDSTTLRLEHAHWPLIAMLLLTQAAAGMFLGAALLAAVAPDIFGMASAPLAASAFVILNLGLVVSVLHLGRPLGAWRAFLGLRTSWMSREIFAFTAFAAAAGAFTGAAIWPWLNAKFPFLAALPEMLAPAGFAAPLSIITAVLAVLSVYCSAMIYIDTRRAFWSAPLAFTKFFATALLLGSAACAAVLAWQHESIGAPVADTTRTFIIAAMVIRTALFGWEILNVRHGLDDSEAPTHRSMRTIWKLGRPLVFSHIAFVVGATCFGVAALTIDGATAALCATASLALTFAAQAIERYFFFTAVVAPRMPGGVAA